ncbi:FCD domain-containing protein [Tardiphaga sp.]|uniref:FadR/GntR family transcriptional regulator n=1 Tax=Tardiphaga sp. TaxID=1926292 RepID=UPI002627F849|nr:FCD domain-containing protein [Tardiphaga sp.]MDB5619294.1 FadR family transcriptional regulator [Tardiphaga sp.]
MNSVEIYIARKRLKDGDRLPPERELAIELGISRRSLRQNLTQLELDGRLWRGRRNGTILGRPPPTAPAGIDRSLATASPSDTMEMRFALEPSIAAIAANKATDDDIARIETCLRRTTEVTDDANWVRWDGAFHLAIAEASRNRVFIALILAFNNARARPEWRKIRVTHITAEKRQNTVAHHRAIFEAIRGRSPEEAARAMRRHLSSVQTHLFD